MHLYMFWVIFGVVAGLFCALLDEGKRMCSDRRLTIQLLSLIVGYTVAVVLFHFEPDGVNWLLTVIVQIACAEITFRLTRPYLAILDPDRKQIAKRNGSAASTWSTLVVSLIIVSFCSLLAWLLAC
jgi:hypothetical protein